MTGAERGGAERAASGSDEDNPAVEYWLYGAGVPERAEKYLFPKPKAKH
jgi:hypothetical protein